MQDQNDKVEVIMVEFDNLEAPPELNEALLNNIDTFMKKNWTYCFQCVNVIRSICKFYPQYIPDLFSKYGPAILDLFNHTTTLLIKNVLKLLMEIFNNGVEINLQGCVQAFLPQLIKKAAIDTCHATKQLSQQVLTVIASKCCYCNTIEITTGLSDDKNLAIAQTSIKLLAGILSSLSSSLTQINPGTLQTIIRGMYLMIIGKRNTIKTSALDVCIFIYTQIGSENYLQLMNYSLKENQVNDMTQAMEQHRTQKPRPQQFSDVIRQHKATMRHSGVYSQNMRM